MNQTTIPHFDKNDFTMISLNVPNNIKNTFDNVCKFKRFSRTSMLIRLMENFLRTELKQMKSDNDINVLIKNVTKKHNSKPIKEQPMIPYSSDEEMEEQFWKERIG